MVRANSLFSSFRSFRIPFAFPSVYRSRNNIAIIVYIVLASIIADTFVNQNVQVRNFIGISSNWGIAFFIILAAVTIMGQYYILKFVRHKTREFRRKVRILNISFKVTAISYVLNICLMAVFAEIFFSWYKSNRSSIAVLLYGLSFAVVVITSCVFLTGSLNRFLEKPVYISPFSNIELTKSEPGSIQNLLGKIYHYSDIVSFALKWIATVFLLYHYSQKMGRAKYWILISLPLLYFLGTYLDDFHIYEPKNELEEFYWQIYVTLNSTAGGILFYIGFLVAAKHFQDDWAIKDYLLICGFGFLLFFNAGQSTLANSLYPPYGLATMSFYGLSSFLILLGLYSSAVSISQDSGLRRLIIKLATNEMNLLRSIGTAHREAEVWKRVNK